MNFNNLMIKINESSIRQARMGGRCVVHGTFLHGMIHEPFGKCEDCEGSEMRKEELRLKSNGCQR